jgi:hypothetical protein
MSRATLSDRPYVNANPFSGHYLDERVQERDEWDCDDDAREAMDDLQTLYELEGSLVEGYGEDALMDDWIDEVLDVLGFGTQAEVTLPNGGFVDELRFETPTARRDAVERAAELDEKIQRTDDLIDEVVYDLYGLTDEELEIVGEAVADDWESTRRVRALSRATGGQWVRIDSIPARSRFRSSCSGRPTRVHHLHREAGRIAVVARR